MAGRAILDQYYAAMRDFSDEDLGDVLMKIAAYSAYAAELRGKIVRSETRRATSFRTKELDPFLTQCEFQFKVWSRYQSVRQMEYDLSKGGI